MVTSAISWYWSSQPLILDKRERKKEEEERRRKKAKWRHIEGILKGGWGVNENGEAELTRSTGPNWTLKDQIWEWGGIRRRGGPGIPPQVRAEAEQWIENVRLARTGGNQEETTARGGLQIDPQNKSGRNCLSRLTLKKGFRWTNQGKDTETIVLLDINVLSFHTEWSICVSRPAILCQKR